MYKPFTGGFLILAASLLCIVSSAMGVDVKLAENSTLEGILERGELRIGLEVGYMPFEMRDKRSGLRQKNIRHGDVRRKGRQLRIIGFDIDMGIEMAKALGVKPVFVDTLWPSIIPALRLGRYDIIFGGMSVTEARKEEIDFAEPFMTVGQTILLNKKHAGSVKTYEDLNDPKFVVVSKPATTGEAAVQEMIPDCTYKPFDTEMSGANEVLNGSADAFVYDLPFNAVFMAMHGKDKLVFLDQPFTHEPLAWAIRKNDPDFLKFLNEFLGEVKADGRFERMYEKWFKSTEWFQHVR
jgi:polar amino acid transport system substrate-binding protein